MFTRADIRRVSIAVTTDDYGALMVSLGRSRLVHLEKKVYDVDAEKSMPAVNPLPAAAMGTAEKIVETAERFISEAGESLRKLTRSVEIFSSIHSFFDRDSESDLREAERTGRKIAQYNKIRSSILREKNILEQKIEEISRMQTRGIDLEPLRQLRFVSYIYSKNHDAGLPVPLDSRIFTLRATGYSLLLFPRELEQNLPGVMRATGNGDLDYITGQGNTADAESAAVTARLKELERRLDRIDSFYKKFLPRWIERMEYLGTVYSIMLAIRAAEQGILFSGKIAVINGWIDLRDEKKLESLLKGVCSGGYYIKTASRLESMRLRYRMPVLLRNSRFLRPFELLVKMMGVPGNSEVDPTPAAAAAYLLIFGVMFGDLGQGLVLAFTGLLLIRYGSKKYGGRNSVSDAGGILAWCGFSSAVFGILYGSVFSSEHIIPALLFHPMEQMMQLLLMAVMAGALFIFLGLLLNVVNSIMAYRYAESFFGLRGLPGVAVYGLFMFFAGRFILFDHPPRLGQLAAAFAVPAAVFCLRGPLEYFLFRGSHPFHDGLFAYVVETLIGIMEIFSGFLGSTVSYIRAGAFALSHAGLGIAVFTLAGIVDPSLTGPGALAVIITGNIFIILLEGLVCGIQSMRLEFYEFFGKFFTGDGIEFVPFSFGLKGVKDGGGK